MPAREVTIGFSQTAASYQITVANGGLARVGKWARKCLGKSASRVVVISDRTVFRLYGEKTVSLLKAAGFDVRVFEIKDGEEQKNLANIEAALDFFAAVGLTRTDAVVALGGGVVGDLAGFAAAIYLRGIAFLQVPTTLLAMIDSSVGGKTGVNSAAGKNSVGSFHQPGGVLIDTDVLRTLPTRELTAGFCEAVKQGVLSGKGLFTETADLLRDHPPADFPSFFTKRVFRDRLDALIEAQVKFKASIVQADERESTKRTDARSRKILNFGHTLAHALEKVTNYSYFKHGEAVGYGMLYAAELSKMLALCDENVVNLLYDVVHRAGQLPSMNKLDPQEVYEAFRFDKKVVAGSLQMILLKGIGKPCIYDGNDIPRSIHTKALKNLLSK